MLHKNISINKDGHLTFAGMDVVALAETYGTPLMLLDEDRIRENIRVYKRAMTEHFGEGSFPLFASKALLVMLIIIGVSLFAEKFSEKKDDTRKAGIW